MAVGYRADAQNHEVTLSLGSITQFSVTCWFRLNADRNSYSTVWDVGVNNSNLFGLQTETDGTTLETYDTNGSTGTHTAALTVGTWYYFAVNMNGVNGNWEYRAANTGTFTAGSWTSGSASVTATRLMLGESGFGTEWGNIDIAAFKMWHGANLSTVQMHQESYLYLPQRSSNLTCFFPLVGQTLVTDYSGNGRTLTAGTGSSVVDGPPIVWGSAYPIVFLPSAPSIDFKNVNDSGSATESLSVNSAVSLTESGSANDLLAVSPAVNLSDSGSASESISVARFITLSDSGSATESLSVVSAASLTDSGSASEALNSAVALAIGDSATGTDVVSAGVSATLSDTATSVDAISVAAALTLTESATGTDSLVSGMPVSLADSATSTESLSSNVAVSLSDSGVATDSLSVVVTPLLSDSGLANEALSTAVSVQLADTASALESLANTVAIALSDTGSALETLVVGVSVSLQDAAQASESLSLGESKTLSDSGTATDSLSVVVTLSLTDSGVSHEVVLADGMRFLFDHGSAVDVLYVSDGSVVIPGRMTLGDITSPLMVLGTVSFSTVEGNEGSRTEMQLGDGNSSRMEGS